MNVVIFLRIQRRAAMLQVGFCICVVSMVLSAQQSGLKNFGNREEGTAYETHGSEDLSLIAIHRNFQQFGPKSHLHVRFFIPQLPSEVKGSIFVTASELHDLKHYLMRSKTSTSWPDAAWGEFDKWPTADIIDGLHLKSTNIGVLAGYQPKNERPVYFPVDVYSTSLSAAKTSYTFYFATEKNLHSVDINVTDAGGKEVQVAKPQLACTIRPDCTLFGAGTTLAVDLDLSGLPPGYYWVKLTGHISGTPNVTALPIHLYVHK